MKKKSIFPASVLLACLLISMPATAQDQDQAPGITTREQVEQKLAELRERLDVSDYTWEQVHLILKTSVRERIAIAKKYGLDGSGEAMDDMSGREKRRMRRELKDVRKSTEDRMERYLDKDQMKEFKAIQEEVHEELLNRLEARAS